MNAVEETVFIVDDTEDVRTALSRTLIAAGYHVRSFESAERFLEEQDVETPGCLLLDICMPGMSGLDVQRSLVGSTCGRAIVFVTGYGDIDSSVNAMKMGAVDFLTKPIEVTQLLAAVKRAQRLDFAARHERAVRSMIEERHKSLSRPANAK